MLVELMRSNDPVILSWAEAMLASAGIDSLLFDAHTSILEGSIGILPRRLMVRETDLAAAQALLQALSDERPDP